MKGLADTSLVPPAPVAGFFYREGKPAVIQGQFWLYVESSDTWLFAGDFKALVETYRSHLVTNRMAVPADLEGAVSALICERLPAEWKGCAEAPSGKINFVTWGQAKRWLRTMIAYATDRELVSQETANARAERCLGCRFRVAQADCKTGGCGGTVAGFLTQLAINRTTPYDDRLGACGVCGCVLRAMAWFPNETLSKAAAGLDYPTDTDGNGTPCWRLSETNP